MEIDLNHAVGEVACDNWCLSTATSSCSSSGGSGSSCSLSASSSIYMELWHACAGPLTNFPKKGNLVVYFPQGHLEQLNSSRMEVPTFDLPPQIFCRVVDVQLLANKENDVVYTQLTLLPLPEMVGVKLDGKEGENGEDGYGEAPVKSNSHMFCKTLTASDTSSHGGFSVPRRAAEDCFPPLNYDEQRPSQELVASDLHGVEWKFRHIYRGQPRRHLLTTGWSMFVSQKKLVSGDAVLFLRGEAGDLRLGIRRAARPRDALPDSIITNHNSYPNVLFHVANALSSNGTFNVFYSPRASHSNFVVPYRKYMKCIASPVAMGTRFKVRFDFDDSPERRLTGVVTGAGDADPYKWPNSKWRSLRVRWDDTRNHQERVSPWDVDASSNYAPSTTQPSSRMKRQRPDLEASPHATPITRGGGGGGAGSDYEELRVRSSKVLQGQENAGFLSPLYRSDDSRAENQAATTFTGFLKSNWFPKVLQGQEICSFRSLAGKTDWNLLGSWSKTGCAPHNAYRVPFYPLASEGARNIVPFPYNPPMPSGFQTGNRVMSRPTTEVVTVVHPESESRAVEKLPSCKVFGYSLAEDPVVLDSQGQSKRSCTKVHKQGSLVGRAVDLSRLHGYEELLTELERLFSMEGLLRNPSHGWRLLYTDSENDTMVVGDDPWKEFVEVVSKIHIHTLEEVEKLNVETNSDDTQSSLEEAPPVADLSKSSSGSA